MFILIVGKKQPPVASKHKSKSHDKPAKGGKKHKKQQHTFLDEENEHDDEYDHL